VVVVVMTPDGALITGSDVLMDGGVTAAYWCGGLASNRVLKPGPYFTRAS
jgi:hypothetical protein